MKNMYRPSWDEYFIMISLCVAKRGDCRRRQVGALVVDSDHRIVASGYNGIFPNRPGCLEGACPRGHYSYDEIPKGSSYKENCIAIHAERNALTYFWKAVESGLRILPSSCTMYVSEPPCEWCLRLIQGAGFKRIVYRDNLGLTQDVTPG